MRPDARTSKGDATGGSASGRATGRWQAATLRVVHLAEVDSTNRYVLDEARAGAPPGLVVVADHQTRGRGRLDRRWQAPPGSSLLMSLLLRTGDIDAGVDAHDAVAAVAVAIAEAVGDSVGIDVGLKWPNDLVVGGRKLAGILAETERDALVVGVGCNLNWEAFPPQLADTATACNLEAGHVVDRDAVLRAFLSALARALDSPASTARSYAARLVTIGRRVRVERAGAPLFGTAVAVTGTGALVVRGDDGTDVEVVVGDVVHLRDAP